MPTSFELRDGTAIPWLAWGNGTGQAKLDAVNSGKLALVSGIRHIDTAQIYGNEAETGQAIRESSVNKDDVFVTSKIWCDQADALDSSKIRRSVEESLERLQFSPDCYLIHTPAVGGYERSKLKAIWKVLESMKDEGKLRHIGVSNFRPQDLEAILEDAKHKPVVNQLEVHPYTLVHLEPVFKIHEQHGIITTSYGTLTPLLRHPGGPLKPVLNKISANVSKRYDETIDPFAVLCLWAKAKKIVVVTASGNQERIKGFAKLYQANWELDPKEVEEIDEVGKTVHFRYYDEHMETDFPVPNLPNGKNEDGKENQ